MVFVFFYLQFSMWTWVFVQYLFHFDIFQTVYSCFSLSYFSPISSLFVLFVVLTDNFSLLFSSRCVPRSRLSRELIQLVATAFPLLCLFFFYIVSSLRRPPCPIVISLPAPPSLPSLSCASPCFRFRYPHLPLAIPT